MARCEGSSTPSYRLRAELDAGGVRSADCTYPYDWDGDCKHIVALLLMYLHKPKEFSEQKSVAELLAGMESGLPPIVEHNARSSGADVAGYLTESPGFSTFVKDGGTVFQTYSTTWRGLEFLMSYYPILDHAPKGRDEGEAWQLWIHRHDEYESE